MLASKIRKTTETKYDFPKVGCYIDESAGSANDCNRRTIEFAKAYGFEHGDDMPDADADDTADDYSQWLSETGDEAVSFLNELETRSFMSWQFEDNSLFLMADVDGAREDCGFVSSKQNEQSCPQIGLGARGRVINTSYWFSLLR